MIETQEITIDLSQVYDPRRNEKQMQFHYAPETYKLFGGAMGGGKTAALINEGNQLNLDFPGNFGLSMRKTWPSYRDTVLPQLEKFLDRRLIKNWNLSEKLITYWNGSRIRYGGLGDDPDDWQKFMSGEYGWIALDQAEEFTEKEFLMLATRLRLNLPGIRYFFLLSCNPNIGWIKEQFIERNLPDHIFIPSLPTDNLANLPASYVENMRAILPPMLRKALLEGNWDAVGEPDNVYPYHGVMAAMARKAGREKPVEIGVDVARSGDDETTILLREGLRLSIFSKARGHDLMKTTGEIWRCIKEEIIPIWQDLLDLVTIKVDADGLGAGVVDRLREQQKDKEKEFTERILELVGKEKAEALRKQGYKFKIRIIEIHGAARASDPIEFKNLRAEVHWALRELLDEISLPNDKELLSQLMAIKYKVNSAGQIMIVPKEDIKAKLGRSPDLAEGVIYSLARIKTLEPRIRSF